MDFLGSQPNAGYLIVTWRRCFRKKPAAPPADSFVNFLLPGQRSAAAIEELGAAGIPVTIASRKIEAKEDSCYT